MSRQVVLTSYGTLCSEYGDTAAAPSTGRSVPSGAHGRGRGPAAHEARSRLFRVVWRRVVLDEAHLIKSHNSRVNRDLGEISPSRS